MKNIIAGTAVALLVWSTVPQAQQAQPAPAATPAAPTTPGAATTPGASAATGVPGAPASATDPPPPDNLSDLASMTFGCPKAALNAAAREASKVRSRGTYQFSFFRIVSGSHHAAYEVHFKSNFSGEKDLKYCVAIY